MDGQIQELAYQIVWSTLTGIEANSLESFKELMEGVALFRRYKDSHQIEDFYEAQSRLGKAIKIDKRYARAHFYLGNLYNWRAYWADLDSEDEKTYQEKARKHYQEAGHGYTANSSDAESFMNFGAGLVYHRTYSKVKERYPERFSDKLQELDKSLMEAHKYYTRVVGQDNDFYFAMAGRALIYKEKQYLSGEESLGSTRLNGTVKPELYIHCSMKDLQHAKYIAKDRKDSLRWLDSNLHDVEHKLRNYESSWPRLQAAFSWVTALKSKCLEFDEMPGDNFLHSPLAQHFHRQSIDSLERLDH
jgi:hypothetical protein